MTRTELIATQAVRRQRWRFYAAVVAWPLYLLLIPWAFARLGALGLPLALFPGAYLYAWIGFLMHESRHKLVPGLPNELLFTVYSWMLVTDPQFYRLVHGLHHSEVNAWEDVEFHPLGEIRSRPLRVLYNAAEIVLGAVFVQTVTSLVIARRDDFSGRYRPAGLLAAMAAWVVIFGGAGTKWPSWRSRLTVASQSRPAATHHNSDLRGSVKKSISSCLWCAFRSSTADAIISTARSRQAWGSRVTGLLR